MKKLFIVFFSIVLIIFSLSSCSTTMVFYDQNNDVKVYGDYFPNNTYLSFKYYPFESLAMEEIMASFLQKGLILGEKDEFFIYNIEYISNGMTVRPSKKVEIRIPKPQEMFDVNEYALYNILNEQITKVEFELKGKYICFNTDLDSYFVFIKKETIDVFYIALNTKGPGKIVDKSGQKINFVNLSLGETITVRAVPEKGHKFIGWYNTENEGIYISTDEYYTYTYSDLKENGFFIYAEFK